MRGASGWARPQLTELKSINGRRPDAYITLPMFEELKAVNPDKRLVLETTPDRLTTRTIDMMAPIGRGQRGLIVSPPRAGKTTLLQHIAEAVAENHPSIHLMVVLVDERPEEVTELTRELPGAEIMSSSNDSDAKAHCRIAQLAIERAKRLVEAGEDVFMLMDSITRLGRAFNNAIRGGGRMGSGGIDNRALIIPRKLFAAARNTRDAGSLTIIGTALIDTNSRMDDVIFQEFKGTGNMELVLDRKIAEQYIFPGRRYLQVWHAPRGTTPPAPPVGEDLPDTPWTRGAQTDGSDRTAARPDGTLPEQCPDASRSQTDALIVAGTTMNRPTQIVLAAASALWLLLLH